MMPELWCFSQRKLWLLAAITVGLAVYGILTGHVRNFSNNQAEQQRSCVGYKPQVARRALKPLAPGHEIEIFSEPT